MDTSHSCSPRLEECSTPVFGGRGGSTPLPLFRDREGSRGVFSLSREVGGREEGG